MEWQVVAQNIFFGLVSVVSVYIANSIKEMKTSIHELNIRLAMFTEKASNIESTLGRYESTLERHSDRLIVLEQKTFSCKHNN